MRLLCLQEQAGLTISIQGYELSDDEVTITLDEFRAQYAGPNGMPE